MASRGSKPGERRGGRGKGTPNKRTVDLLEALKKAGLTKDTHPIIAMYRVYMGETTMPVVTTEFVDGERVQTVENVPLEPSLRIKCMAEVAQYLEPKRKAIEVTTPPGEEFMIKVITG